MKDDQLEQQTVQKTEKQTVLKLLKGALDLFVSHFVVLFGVTFVLLLPSLVWDFSNPAVLKAMKAASSVRWYGLLHNGMTLVLYVIQAYSIALALTYLEDRVLNRFEIVTPKQLATATRKSFLRILGVQLCLLIILNAVQIVGGLLSIPLPKAIGGTAAFALIVLGSLLVEAYFFTAPMIALKGVSSLDSLSEAVKLSKKYLKTVLTLVALMYLLRLLVTDSITFSLQEFAKTFKGMDGTILFKSMDLVLQSIVNGFKLALLVTVFEAFNTKKVKQEKKPARPKKKKS